jgi:hypothetical protein
VTRAERILLELIRRAGSTWNVRTLCFDKQIEFIEHEARFKTACCGGRAGKTVADAVYLIDSARKKPRSVSLYLTLSRNNAKKLIWPELLRLNREQMLGAEPNEADLSLKLANDSFVYASGAGNAHEIEKFRGLPLGLCVIDEVQSFKPYVRELIDDVVSKRLFDYNGTLALTGTPGPVPTGYFYDACQNAGYAHFHWTMFDNPWIERKSGKPPQQLMLEEMARKGVTEDDPSIQREVYGRWVTDSSALVFKYDAKRNHFETCDPPCDQFVIGVDLGYDDADAIAVIGWHQKSPKAYLVEEYVRAKQGITELMEQINRLIQRFNPLKVVVDTGGLGKKIAEEIRRRYAVPMEAAEKTRKFEYVELLNDAMRTERFYANRNGRFAFDCGMVEWDRECANPKIKDGYHSDITDAVLYGFREALHWLHEPEVPKPRPNTPAWFDEEAKRLENAAVERLARQQTDEALGW